jgi:hypothetical protein
MATENLKRCGPQLPDRVKRRALARGADLHKGATGVMDAIVECDESGRPRLSGGGSNVTPRKFSVDCDCGSARPTTVGE